MLHRIRDSIIEYIKSQADRILGGKSLRSLVLFLVIFFSLVLGITNAVGGIDRGVLWAAIVLGLPLGFVLAHPRLPGWISALLASLLGLFWTSFRVSDQIRNLGKLFRETLLFLWRTLWQTPSVDPTKLQSTLFALEQAQRDLINRFMIWIQANLTDQALFAYDPLVGAFIWGLILWTLAAWAGWAIRRHQQPFLSALPAVGTLTVILAFVFGRIIYLMPMVVAMLMLKAQFEGERRIRRWERGGMSYSDGIPQEITRTSFVVSSTLVIFAALIPSIYSSRIVEMVWNISQGGEIVQEINHALGLEPRPGSGDGDPFRVAASGILPRDHLIGTAPDLGEQVVMTISVKLFQSWDADPDDDRIAVLKYWRAMTYDQYTGRGWSTGELRRVSYDAGEKITPPESDRSLVRQEIRFADEQGGRIYVSGDLVTVDRDFQVTWSTSLEEQKNLEGMRILVGASIDERIYRADSQIPVYGQDDLRAAGRAYPAWVTQSYLNLPDQVPKRVHELAAELSTSESNPFDQAVAIERYLRRFPYTLDVPTPPADQDIADYFLFDLQKGYCDYYATAMVVMARSAGLPARLATGYIGGSPQSDGQYQVTEDLAHSWPQIYFPGYGWIDFEPTGGRAEIVRPEGSLADDLPKVETDFEPILTQRKRASWRLGSGIGLGILLAFIGSIGIWVGVDSWALRHSTPNEAIMRIFRRLYRYGPRLGLPVQQGETPNEFSASLGNEFAKHPIALKELEILTVFQNRAAYSRKALTKTEQTNAVRVWMRMRRRLLYAWLRQVMNKIRYN